MARDEELAKANFVYDLHRKSLSERDELKAKFFDQAKFIPIAFGASAYLFSKAEINISFVGEGVVWYNLFLLANFALLAVFSVLVIWYYLKPPTYGIEPSYRELIQYWDSLHEYNEEHALETSTDRSLKLGLLSQISEDAANNDEKNMIQYIRLNRVSNLAIALFLSYIVLIMFLVL